MELRSRRLLLDYIKALGWSQRRLAREAGIGHAIVGHLCKGTRKTCSKRTAAAIEGALRCPPNLLFVESVSAVSPSNGQPLAATA